MAGPFDDLIAGDGITYVPNPTDGRAPLRITINKASAQPSTDDESSGQPQQPPPQAYPELSDRDRKLIVRTMLGEAAGEGDEGQQAVASVILNRLKSGQFGPSIPHVVLSKNQFEPWMTPAGRARMLGYAEDSPEYTRAAANLDAILSGKITDPTSGATYFYSPKAQAALGRQPPSWAQGQQPIVIGNHNFYGGKPPAAKVASADKNFTPVPSQNAFADILGGGEASGTAAPAFKERFSGEGIGTPSGNATELAGGLRNKADTDLIERAYGYKPSQAEQSFDTVVAELANTFLLNVPRNIGALYLSHKYDVPFDQAYDSLKAVEEARARQNPKSATAGTLGGIGAGMVALPEVKLAEGAGMAGRTLNAAATGAGYGVASELLDSKDPIKASVAGAMGAVLGGVASPVAEKIVGLVSKMVAAGKAANTFLKPDGTLSDEAIAAAKEAGIEPSLLQQVMQAKYAETFKRKGATPATAREAAASEFGVRLSPGEAAQDYGAIAKEQSMARDTHGPLAGNVARKFYSEREGEIGKAKEGIQQKLADGPYPTGPGVRTGNALVESTNEAANVVGQGVREKAATAKAAVKGAYDEALAKEGEFSDIAFRDIGERIRRDNLKSPEPVIIDDITTPVAARAIQHLDNTIGKLRIQDRAEPRSMEARTAGYVKLPGEPERVGGKVAPQDDVIAGVSLKGVEQSRKQLVDFYKAAKASGNASDIRAMRRIIAGFDDELETAMATGLFKGDEEALPALKRARELFSNYQKTFSTPRINSVGRDMKAIIDQDASGAKIANMLWGKTAIGERSESVALARHLKQLFGETSREWAAIRQGLWLRMTSKPDGATDFGPQALSERISKFLSGDGADMAKVVFTPQELGMMRRFATVMKTITPPPGAVNHSGTGYELARQMLAGTGIGAAAYWMTDDPLTAAALAATKVGGRLGRLVFKGRMAARHFASGAPKAVNQAGRREASRAAGIGAGLGAGQALP